MNPITREAKVALVKTLNDAKLDHNTGELPAVISLIDGIY